MIRKRSVKLRLFSNITKIKWILYHLFHYKSLQTVQTLLVTLSSEGSSLVHSHSVCLNVIPENLTLTADILSSSLPSECSSSTSRASVKGCAPPYNPVRYMTWQATSSAATCQMQMQSPPPSPPSTVQVQVQRAMIIKSWTDWPASHTPRSSHALWQWMHTAPHSTAKRAAWRESGTCV